MFEKRAKGLRKTERCKTPDLLEALSLCEAFSRETFGDLAQMLNYRFPLGQDRAFDRFVSQYADRHRENDLEGELYRIRRNAALCPKAAADESDVFGLVVGYHSEAAIGKLAILEKDTFSVEDLESVSLHVICLVALEKACKRALPKDDWLRWQAMLADLDERQGFWRDVLEDIVRKGQADGRRGVAGGIGLVLKSFFDEALGIDAPAFLSGFRPDPGTAAMRRCPALAERVLPVLALLDACDSDLLCSVMEECAVPLPEVWDRFAHDLFCSLGAYRIHPGSTAAGIRHGLRVEADSIPGTESYRKPESAYVIQEPLPSAGGSCPQELEARLGELGAILVGASVRYIEERCDLTFSVARETSRALLDVLPRCVGAPAVLDVLRAKGLSWQLARLADVLQTRSADFEESGMGASCRRVLASLGVENRESAAIPAGLEESCGAEEFAR